MSAAAGSDWDARAPFARRAAALPRLGVGISTEFGAGRAGLDVNRLAREHPRLVRFLEVGADLERGADLDARRWVAEGRPTTLHFLDLNLEEPEDLDEAWVRDTAALARELRAAWLCGDAGLWHVGPRERGHGLLQPPILVPESADAMADSVRALREASGLEVLPENPPGHVFLGELHPLDYYARVLERADCGMLLDVAHLAIAQRALRRPPLEGLERFPLERVLEVHVAGASLFEHRGRTFVDDDHGLAPLEDTWTILEHVLARAERLRAVVVECERNRLEDVLPLFRRVHAALAAACPDAALAEPLA